MECNKEEAFKAQQIAETHMQKNEFSRAVKFAQTAYRLFPALENITQLLTVCEVHCTAETKLGSEHNWYGILQIEKSADENTIKKQYRKLALLLHPDKNKFVGSEAAFKLIGEAYRILGDRAKRSLYDLKMRGLANSSLQQKPPPAHETKEKSSVVNCDGIPKKTADGSTSCFADSNGTQKVDEIQTFWTFCPTCLVKYQYYKTYLNRSLRCQSCRKPFKAYECTDSTTSSQWRPVAAEKNASSGGSHKVTSQKGGNSYPPTKDQHEEYLPKAKDSADNGCRSEHHEGINRHANKGNGKDTEVKMPKSDAGKVEDTSNPKAGSQKKGLNNSPLDPGESHKKVSGKTNVENGGTCNSSGTQEGARRDVNAEKGKNGVKKPTADAKKVEEANDSRTDLLKSGMNNCPADPGESHKKVSGKTNVENGGTCNSSGTQEVVGRDVNDEKRKNGVKMPISEAKKVEEANDSRTDPLKSRMNNCPADSGKASETIAGKPNAENVGNVEQSHSAANVFHTTSRSTRRNKQVSYKEDLSDDDDYVVASKKPRSSAAGEYDSRRQKNVESPAAAGDQKNSKLTEPKEMSCPDPEFNDFEKDKQQDCFAVNQVWAIYDEADGMPRYYARVKKVFTQGFKLKIKWFEAEPDEKDRDEINWCDKNLPVACGRYVYGDFEVAKDRLMFSHQMMRFNGTRTGTFTVYPRKGETWALFMNWDIKWSSEPEKHDSFEYEYVEVLSDFVEGMGITVAYLVKVEGFVSLFQRTAVKPFQIHHRDLYRFSHSIPSFRMTGREREGVPKGSFELDPAALPLEVTATGSGNSAEKKSFGGGSESSVLEDATVPSKVSEKDSIAKKLRKESLEPLLVRRSPRGVSKLSQSNSDPTVPEVNSSTKEELQKATGSSTSTSEHNMPAKRRREDPDQNILPMRKSARGREQNR